VEAYNLKMQKWKLELNEFLQNSGARAEIDSAMNNIRDEQCRVLQNMQVEGLMFWRPFRSRKEFEESISGWTFENTPIAADMVLKDQLLERMEEIKSYFKIQVEMLQGSGDTKLKILVEGFPGLVKDWYAHELVHGGAATVEHGGAASAEALMLVGEHQEQPME
jgi:hypothetical protein